MQRVHINITVSDLQRSVGFHTTGAITNCGEDLGPEAGVPAATA